MNADATAGVADTPLAQLLSDHWEWTLARWPEWATRLGDHRYDDRASDRSAEAANADLEQLARFLARADGLDRTTLSAQDADTLALFQEELKTSLLTGACHMERWSVGARDNPVVWMNELAETQAPATPADGAKLVARYRALAGSIDQATATLSGGLAEGRTANAESVRRTLTMMDAALAAPLEGWLIVVKAAEPHLGWSSEETAQHAAAVLEVARAELLPAVTRFRDLLREGVLPVAREGDQVGLWALPDGRPCYSALILRHTSLPLTPEAVHQTGLDALASVHAELRALGLRLFGTEDLPTIFARLRTDPTLYFTSSAEVEARAQAALDAARAAAPAAFGELPATRCEVRPIPDYEAPFTTVAYYMPSIPGEAPGYYYINTYAPETRPRYEAAVLAYHESVPGHHLQIAFAQELGMLPAFRRHLGTTAYVEGWALYTERLAEELGLYADDLDRMGMLSFDAWRASRLVVDTGIHAMGWTREQAERFLLENTPLAENNIDNEVDRYISWPGQAVSYKLGQLEILSLRAKAEAALGERFSLPGFHAAVLKGGAVTLPVLEMQVARWQAEVLAQERAH